MQHPRGKYARRSEGVYWLVLIAGIALFWFAAYVGVEALISP